MKKVKKVAKVLISDNYGSGIYSWGYDKLAGYLPLIEWLEKTGEELISKYVKKYELDLINLSNEDIKNKLLNIDTEKIKDQKEKELIAILQDYVKNIDNRIYLIFNTELKIEELYPGDIIWIRDYDGMEIVEYCPYSGSKILTYEKALELNTLHFKKYIALDDEQLTIIKAKDKEEALKKLGREAKLVEIKKIEEIV